MQKFPVLVAHLEKETKVMLKLPILAVNMNKYGNIIQFDNMLAVLGETQRLVRATKQKNTVLICVCMSISCSTRE